MIGLGLVSCSLFSSGAACNLSYLAFEFLDSTALAPSGKFSSSTSAAWSRFWDSTRHPEGFICLALAVL